jgi:anti-sigma-K factor RskA
VSEQPPGHEMHLLTGAYAAGALDAGERDAFEVHLRSCETCRQEVAELTATTARLGSAAAVPPPPALRARVLDEIARTRQLPPRSDLVDLDARRTRWYRQPTAAAAAVLLVVAVGLGGFAVTEHRRATEARDREQQIAAVVSDPGATVRRVAVTGGGSGTVVLSGNSAVFLARDLPELPSDRAYQLWRMHGLDTASAASAGVLGRGGDVTALVDGVGPSDSIAVTVEPSSGSERPTSSPVFLVSRA